MGTSIISQKKKKRNRSSAIKTPSTPPRIQSRLRWKKPMRCTISFHEQRMASTPIKQVRITIKSDRPSTARCKEMPKRGIHGRRHSAAQAEAAPETPALSRPVVAREKSPLSQMAQESSRLALMESRATQRTNCPPRRSICQQSKPPIKGISKIQSKVTVSALVQVHMRLRSLFHQGEQTAWLYDCPVVHRVTPAATAPAPARSRSPWRRHTSATCR